MFFAQHAVCTLDFDVVWIDSTHRKVTCRGPGSTATLRPHDEIFPGDLGLFGYSDWSIYEVSTLAELLVSAGCGAIGRSGIGAGSAPGVSSTDRGITMTQCHEAQDESWDRL